MKATHVVNMVGPACLVPVKHTATGGIRFQADLDPGIYRVTAILDASRFDWERLYFPMTRFNNQGQRTGPWDFDFEKVEPVIPAWWASVNGERLGLATVSRLSPSEVQNRRMTLSWCFEITRSGPARIVLDPFNASDVTAIRMILEAEPYDRPVPLKLARPLREASLAAAQVQAKVWESWDEKLRHLGRSYEEMFQRCMALALGEAADTDLPRVKKAGAHAPETVKAGQRVLDPEMLPLLAFAWRARGDERALLAARQIVRQKLALEHWGNQCSSGYGHDADMGVAGLIEPLAHAWHWFGEALNDGRDTLQQALRDKLRLQMQRFYTKMLVWADYWGGSILQDHGHRSVCRFGVAAIHMLGAMPEAKHWLLFVAARMGRVLEALPEDGGIPSSSYYKVHLYLDDMTSWRDAWLHAAGEDIFDRPLFRKAIRFVVNRLDQQNARVMVANPRGDRIDFYAGWGFFNAVAARFGDADAATLTDRLMRVYQHRPMAQRPAATFVKMLEHAPAVGPGEGAAPGAAAPAKVRPSPPRLLPDTWDFRTSVGLASYRPPRRDVCVAVLTPARLFHQALLNNPCDRAFFAPLEGHFTVHVGGHALLLTAEGGYRMRSSLGCVLLLDGRGGYDDIDYAMGTPGIAYRGQHVEAAWYDARTGRAGLRLNLAPAYAREAGLLHYVREFELYPEAMRVRDSVVASSAREFSWCFQTYADRHVKPAGKLAFTIREGDAALTLRARAVETGLTAGIKPTDVVWAYSNENGSRPFCHVAYATQQPVQVLTAEFDVAW